MDAPGDGVLVSHGDQGGGYVLYVEDGRPHFAYNEYGVLQESDAGPVPRGPHEIAVSVTAEKGPRRRLSVAVDGVERAAPDRVHQLIGMAPFQGISVGVDRRSPVSWPLHQRHGGFRHTEGLRSVTYRPGAAAPDSPAAVAAAPREAAAAFA